LLAAAERCVALHQLAHDQLHRPAVGNDVVHGQGQHVLALAGTQQRRAQQRLAAQVERLAQALAEQLLDARLGRFAGLQGLQRQGERLRLADELQHLVLILDETSAQGAMARQQGIKCRLQGAMIELALQAQGGGNVVGSAMRVQLPEEPLALLGVRQA
jgi:hypothetical protein